ncbi:MAG TPA: glutathione S-transferase family protein [Steroidobacteraceae bacterium]|jgi:glutathione S-transferase|nr:glutathione S-transferase family protein [Steroidobacteraceae bacterium]
MNEFIVHSVPGSPYGRAVLITLEEKGVRYRLAAVAPGTARTAEHLARHPFGRVPTLEHGDFSLYETQAILRYLDRVLPEPALTPTDARAAARMDLLMNVNDWYLFQGCQNVIGFQRIIAPRLLGLAPDEGAIAAAMPRAHQVFDELARILADQPFFVGDTLTLADIMLAPQLDFLRELPEWETLTSRHANLRGWLERVNQCPSLQATTWQHVAAMAQAA